MTLRPGTAALAALASAACSLAAHADPSADCRQSRNPEARVVACTAIITDASSTEEQRAIAFRYRAGARADAGAIDLAIADYDKALKFNPNDATALIGRGHSRISRNEIDAAIEDFNAALALNPASAGTLVSRGHAYTIKGLADLAIADFTEAMRLSPKSASAVNHRGLAYRKKGDTDRAIEDYTAAIALNPNYALAYSNRGHAYESKGNKAEAIADFSRALSFDRSMVGAAAGLKRLGAALPAASENEALVAKGRDLVEANCSRCHATGATGASANPKSPEFRSLQNRHPLVALREPLSRGIAAVHDEMPKFKLSDAELDSIVAYINSLAVLAGK